MLGHEKVALKARSHYPRR